MIPISSLPPALCADRRNGPSAVRRLLLLDTYDEPPRPFGAAGQVDFLADVRWDACDFSAHAPHRLHGLAPRGVHLPARPDLGHNKQNGKTSVWGKCVSVRVASGFGGVIKQQKQ